MISKLIRCRYPFFCSQSEPSPEALEKKRLRALPRYTPASTTFLGKPLEIVDACTYFGGVKEIFKNEIYAFETEAPAPVILDCGANIGLSVLYFKQRFPQAHLTAFEPDPEIFKTLCANIEAHDFSDIIPVQAAVWVENGEIPFLQEGGFSGRIFKNDSKSIPVPSIRLRDYLCQKIHFLKIDIEGAELTVLEDCADRLHWVERLFVEYHSEAGQPQRLDELLALCRSAGFRYQIQEAQVAPHPFLERPRILNMDLQLNIFCYRGDA